MAVYVCLGRRIVYIYGPDTAALFKYKPVLQVIQGFKLSLSRYIKRVIFWPAIIFCDSGDRDMQFIVIVDITIAFTMQKFKRFTVVLMCQYTVVRYITVSVFDSQAQLFIKRYYIIIICCDLTLDLRRRFIKNRVRITI